MKHKLFLIKSKKRRFSKFVFIYQLIRNHQLFVWNSPILSMLIEFNLLRCQAYISLEKFPNLKMPLLTKMSHPPQFTILTTFAWFKVPFSCIILIYLILKIPILIKKKNTCHLNTYSASLNLGHEYHEYFIPLKGNKGWRALKDRFSGSTCQIDRGGREVSNWGVSTGSHSLCDEADPWYRLGL